MAKTNSISLVITVLNEAKTIESLLKALLRQKFLPIEVIIVDGGSGDETVAKIKQFFTANKPNFTLKTKILPNANRSQARNWGIVHAKHNLIAITDAGCVPQPDWLENLVTQYQTTQADIISGFFYGLSTTPFEQAAVAYTLEMPDRINPDTFLPTTRSVLFTKKIWQQLGGFDETLSLNEDFAFFWRAKQRNVSFSLAKNALVGWLPRRTWSAFAQMIYRFAQGDTQAGIIRPKVKLLFARYLIALITVIYLLSLTTASLATITFFYSSGLIIYFLWAISKNLKYTPRGWFWLPMLQLTADACVMAGSIVGGFHRLFHK
jgi:glycosyltransferase involved in cell wall biosynthesis